MFHNIRRRPPLLVEVGAFSDAVKIIYIDVKIVTPTGSRTEEDTAGERWRRLAP